MDIAQTYYEQLNGEAGVKQLVERFYELMDTQPETYAIRQMHPLDLAGSRHKLFLFLSGWLGGPPLYIETYGHPRLRARHLPFPIDVAARDQWLLCMNTALDEQVDDKQLKQALKLAFYSMADHMRNQAN